MATHLAWAWSCGALLPLPAHSDISASVNWARLHGCRNAATMPLHDDARLAAAASRVSSGQSLHRSLAAAGYLAVQSSAAHLSGAVDDAALGRALAARECDRVADPTMTEMGAQRRGHDVWLVLAAPAWLPSKSDAAAIGQQILGLVNDARAAGRRCGGKAFPGVGPLVSNASLTAAAAVHSQDMAEHEQFDHVGHDGSTPGRRATRAGFGSFRVVGENIAAGAMTPADLMNGWLASPPHCENLMDPRFTAMGVAFAVNTASAELVYWTLDLAARHR